MSLKKKIRLNKRGFTLIEVLIATFVGLGMLISVFYIPLSLAEVHFFISDNLEHVQDVNLVSSYVYRDIEKGIVSVTNIPEDNCIDIENMADTDLRYCFSDTGIIRRLDGVQKELSELKSTYYITGNTLTILMTYDEKKPPYELMYLLDYPIIDAGGDE